MAGLLTDYNSVCESTLRFMSESRLKGQDPIVCGRIVLLAYMWARGPASVSPRPTDVHCSRLGCGRSPSAPCPGSDSHCGNRPQVTDWPCCREGYRVDFAPNAEQRELMEAAVAFGWRELNQDHYRERSGWPDLRDSADSGCRAA